MIARQSSISELRGLIAHLPRFVDSTESGEELTTSLDRAVKSVEAASHEVAKKRFVVLVRGQTSRVHLIELTRMCLAAAKSAGDGGVGLTNQIPQEGYPDHHPAILGVVAGWAPSSASSHPRPWRATPD